MYSATFTAPVAAPFNFGLTVWLLRRRAKNTIDHWQNGSYSRILVLDKNPVEFTARMADAPEPKLSVRLRSQQKITQNQQAEIKFLTQKMFGLNVDLQSFYSMAAHNPTLSRLASQFHGVRPTRYPTTFEALANAIVCQQISLDAGISVLNRLAASYGLPFSGGKTATNAFPQPADLVDASPDKLRALGLSHQKIRAIKSLAYGIENGDIQLDQLETTSNQEAATYLQTIHGVGRWSAEYTLLRGLGRLDVFPGDDIGGQNNVQKLLGLAARPSYEELKTITEAWRPYAGFVYFLLLLDGIKSRGLV